MKLFLFFSNSCNGHYPEYIHHLYWGVCQREKIHAVFAVPHSFQEKMVMFDWPFCPRIQWEFIPDKQLPWGAWYKRNFLFSQVLRACIKKYQPDEAFAIALELLMPYIAFMIPHKTKLSGVLYEIYPYRWQSLSVIRRFSAIVWHWLYAKIPQFHHIFTLNDRSAAKTFNRIYHTDHFSFLPDPFNPIEIKLQEDCREKYRLSNKKIILHFGSMGRKKGTLEILKTILAMPQTEAVQYAFVFAGVIQPAIKDEFYQLYERCIKKTTVLVFNQFCTYDFIGNWCMACDAILLPYLETYNSSGCIGYAAQFQKPVIAPRTGLLGKLVRKNQLGILLNEVSEDEIQTALLQVGRQEVSTEYLTINTVEAFCQRILDSYNK